MVKLQLDRRPLGQRIASAALLVLLVAICLTFAVDLLRAIWPWLLGIAMVFGFITVMLRFRGRAKTRW